MGVTMHLVCQHEARLKTFAYFPGLNPPTLGIMFFCTLYLLVAARDLLKLFLQRTYLQLAPPPPPELFNRAGSRRLTGYRLSERINKLYLSGSSAKNNFGFKNISA